MRDSQQSKGNDGWASRTRSSRDLKREPDASGISACQPAVTGQIGQPDNEDKDLLEEKIKQALLSDAVMAAIVKAINQRIHNGGCMPACI